jgi:hypothetical protein
MRLKLLYRMVSVYITSNRMVMIMNRLIFTYICCADVCVIVCDNNVLWSYINNIGSKRHLQKENTKSTSINEMINIREYYLPPIHFCIKNQ